MMDDRGNGRNFSENTRKIGVRNPYHFALIVGINHYPAIGDLKGAIADSEIFADWLINGGGGVPASNMISINGHRGVSTAVVGSAKPARHDFEKALYRLNQSVSEIVSKNPAAWKLGRLYVYVAGHGIMPHSGRAALLMANARPGWLENVDLSAYAEYYEASGIFREVLIIADCCERWEPRIPRTIVPFDGPVRRASQALVLTGLATRAETSAFEPEGAENDTSRGQFTQAIVRGLTGEANIDPDYRCVTSATLSQYASAAVIATTSRLAQLPTVQIQHPVEPILFHSPQRTSDDARSEIRVVFPSGWRSPSELLSPGGSRLECVPVNNQWIVSLTDGLYAIVTPGTFISPFSNGVFLVNGASNVVEL